MKIDYNTLLPLIRRGFRLMKEFVDLCVVLCVVETARKLKNNLKLSK